MSTKQIAISDFCEHAADEMAAVESGQIVVELTRDGQVIACVSPVPKLIGATGTLADWVGSGIGTVAFAPGIDPDEPGFSLEEWEEQVAKQDVRDWLTASIGLAKGKFTTDERLVETRGEG